MELWRVAPGFEGLYEVSDLGRVRSIGTRVSNRLLKLHTRTRDQYVTVGLCKNKVRTVVKVHRLVALAFIANTTALPDVDHINGQRGDNRAANLRWSTKSDNAVNRHNCFGASGEIGVFASKSVTNPWRASYRKQHLGCFPTKEAAAEARAIALKGVAHG